MPNNPTHQNCDALRMTTTETDDTLRLQRKPIPPAMTITILLILLIGFPIIAYMTSPKISETITETLHGTGPFGWTPLIITVSAITAITIIMFYYFRESAPQKTYLIYHKKDRLLNLAEIGALPWNQTMRVQISEFSDETVDGKGKCCRLDFHHDQQKIYFLKFNEPYSPAGFTQIENYFQKINIPVTVHQLKKGKIDKAFYNLSEWLSGKLAKNKK